MNPRDLIRIARDLAGAGPNAHRGRPRQTDLCRAVSTAYYALFHRLARCCADSVAGSRRGRGQPVWTRTYRALEHGLAKTQCNNVFSINDFSSEIQIFAGSFVRMQDQRHQADYNPDAKFSRLQVMKFIDEVERAIVGLDAADSGQRRAFAIHVLFRQRTQQPSPLRL